MTRNLLAVHETCNCWNPSVLVLPPSLSGPPSNLATPLRRHRFRPRLAALPPQLDGGFVLRLFGLSLFLALVGSNLHHADGVADHVARSFGALCVSRHKH